MSDGESNRHGGVEHRYWVRRLAEHLRANGYTVDEEFPIGGGKTIDLVATRAGKRIAFEIETGKSDASSNVRKCLNAGMGRVVVVVVVAISRRAKASIEPTLPNDPSVVCVTPDKVLGGKCFALKQPGSASRKSAPTESQGNREHREAGSNSSAREVAAYG